jgi:hypothetical protein
VRIFFEAQVEECSGFFIAALVCTVYPALPPQIPGSGFRVPGSAWRFLLVESCHSHSTIVSLTTCAPAQPCTPPWPRHPAARTGRVGPAVPSRASRGPARRRHPAAVEARWPRSSGPVQGWSRQGLPRSRHRRQRWQRRRWQPHAASPLTGGQSAP